MENRQTSLKIHDEKFIRQIDYDGIENSRIYKKQSDKTHKSLELKPCQKVVISIKTKPPVLKTLYIAEKNRFTPQKNSDRCGSRLAIGDHSSLTSRYSNDNISIVSAVSSTYTRINNLKFSKHKRYQNKIKLVENSSISTENKDIDVSKDLTNYVKKVKPCSAYFVSPQITMNLPKIEKEISKPPITKLRREEATSISSVVENIYKKINNLEEKIVEQDMVIRSINQHLTFSSSSDEETNKKINKLTSNDEQPGCSYIEYSHIPGTSAFQRQSQASAPFCDSKATTMDKEHNSEQYGRDFTLYDNITAKGKRQSASVPCKRNETPKYAERAHKIRHKLNPVRDYRLMDTVHYLAQGEFAPRDDGIKLTPSREAVLSDIIWEDVCRTHWPNTRLARRPIHTERCSTRSDLQSLIDNLLRERVAHIERRKRRHYRIVKLNNRHETCRPLGDIIVASNKNNQNCEEKNYLSDNDYMTERIRSKLNKSKERLMKNRQRSRQIECSPGPSCVARNKESTCCYHTGNSKSKRPSNIDCEMHNKLQEPSSNSSINTSKNPRFVIKKNSSQRRYRSNEPNLEHFILLPTLVVRTPSNVKRQKKFNELYHRILNVQIKKAQNDEMAKTVNESNTSTPTKKDIGFNINITLSESEEKLNKK